MLIVTKRIQGGSKMEQVTIIPRMPRMLTLKELSKETGLAYEFLRKLCLNKQIVFVKSGAKYLVNYDRFIDYLNGDLVRKAAGE